MVINDNTQCKMQGLNQFIRSSFPEIVLDYFDLFLFLGIGLLILKEFGPKYFMHVQKQRIAQKWSTSPKDIVILHAPARGPTVPGVSPFALKLETFLRMGNIPYQFDDEFPMGNKGKTPWITLNGRHLTDSQLIVEFLAKKFDVTLGHYSVLERAQGKAVRVMTEEHLYWGGVVWRFSYCDAKALAALYTPMMNKLHWLIRKLAWTTLVAKFRAMASAQGSGRHSYDEVVGIMNDSMNTLSTILGDKKFLLGDEPVEDDAAVFGLLAQGLWASPGPLLEELFKRFPNLKDYTIRMREKYWPDWDDLLAKNYVMAGNTNK